MAVAVALYAGCRRVRPGVSSLPYYQSECPTASAADSRLAKKAAVSESTSAVSYAAHTENVAACAVTMAQSAEWTSFPVRCSSEAHEKRFVSLALRGALY
jgi:hypothetical protein